MPASFKLTNHGRREIHPRNMLNSLGRNDRCSCGSGRKYKRCCLEKGNQLNHPQNSSRPPQGTVSQALTLQFIASAELTALKKGVVQRELFFKADHFLRHGKFSPLRVRREGSIFVISGQVDHLGVRAEALSFSSPLQFRCDCSTDGASGRSRGELFCAHTAFLSIALWGALHGEPIESRLLPSVTEKIEQLQIEMARQFPEVVRDPRTGPSPADSAAGAEKGGKVTLLKLLFCPPAIRPVFKGGPILAYPDFIEMAVLPVRGMIYGHPYSPIAHEVTHGNIPQLLHSSNFYWRDESMKDRDDLLNSLQYLFSDGSILTAREILYHPYVEKTPRLLLPLRSNLLAELSHSSQYQLYPGARGRDWYGEKELERVILSVLISGNAQSVPVSLVDSPDRKLRRRALTFDKVELSVKRVQAADWRLVPAQAESGQAPDTCWGGVVLEFGGGTVDGGALFPTFEITHGSGERSAVLAFHTAQTRIATVGQVLGYTRAGGAADSMPLRYKLHGHQAIESLLMEVNQALRDVGEDPIVVPVAERLPASRVTPELWLDSSGGLRFAFVLSTEQGKFRLWNFPDFMRFIAGISNQGLGSVSRYKNTSLAQRRKGEKRDRDLKVLRHSGLASLFIHEVLSALPMNADIAGGQDSRGRASVSESKLRAAVFKSLGRAIIALESGTQPTAPPEPPDSKEQGKESFERLCSKNIVILAEQLIQVIAKNADSSVPEFSTLWSPWGALQVAGLDRLTLQVVQALLNASLATVGPVIFSKPKTGVFGSFYDIKTGEDSAPADWTTQEGLARTHRTVESHRDLPSILSNLLSLRTQGFEIYWNGLPVEEASDSDLQARLRIIEEEGEKESVSGMARGSGKIDWFELHPQVFFRGREIDPARLKDLARDGIVEFQGKHYLIKASRLPQVRKLEEFWSALQEGRSLSRERSKDTHYLLPRSQTLELLALRASGAHVEGGREWEEIRDFYDSLSASGEGRKLEPLPPTVFAELKPYQRSGVQWLADLYRLRLGGILADDMGLGKTVQTLAFLEKLRCEGKLGPVLIVVPTSLTYNWKSEAARFTPELPIGIFQSRDKEALIERLGPPASRAEGAARGPDFACIVTYGLFLAQADFFSQYQWNILIFDEAQNLKNIAAKRTTKARAIEARFKLCLTGTPLENHLGELYSLLDLVVPGCLGSLTSYREKFVYPELLQPGDLAYLKLKSKPLILRRSKARLLAELPPKTESKLLLPFETLQRKIYRDVALSWNEKVKSSVQSLGEARSQLMMLTALLRLRQVCSDPAGMPGTTYDEDPPKLTVLLDSLEEIISSGESALVFTQFLHTLERLERILKQRNIPCYVIQGGTPRGARERILAEFGGREGGAVLLMTLKTGGVGLNLVKASYVFHIEPWWNPAVENQATDRAHRMGQIRPVQVFRYLMRESVEEKIELLKERKAARFNAIFSDAEVESEAQPGPAGSLLTQEDFSYLLS